MPIIDDVAVTYAKPQIATYASRLAGTELFGLTNCGSSWSSIYMKLSIIDILECTDGLYFTQSQADCLTGRLTKDFNSECC